MSHAEIIEKYNCKTHADQSRVYRNNNKENVEIFSKRVEE